MRRTRVVLTAALVGAGLLLAGCGSADEGDTGESGGEESAAEEMAGDDDTEGTDEDMTEEDDGDMMAATALTTAETDLGTILTDGDGNTIYLFTNDEEGVSNCDGECIAKWPAVEGEPEAGAGVDAALLGSIERSDGTVQATYNGHPLYYFVQDSSPGDTTGQGVNEVWYVLSPEGEMIEAMDDMG
ncbi:COG4315 family predicted lipoprotein [Ruania halotolerans]|uniref:COG4315 family predicted lipoprotein n=1 Tax=Ruania halotolerans TaxID=2897773 RepID=UPI001E2C2250|nr:hypothetical protein [Ruania halotolerans]UFU05948.1 hypothetical protein LQF10_16195 [Ruania halotolerans]